MYHNKLLVTKIKDVHDAQQQSLGDGHSLAGPQQLQILTFYVVVSANVSERSAGHQDVHVAQQQSFGAGHSLAGPQQLQIL